MGRRKLILIPSFAILAFIILLGVYTVFTVNAVSVYYNVASERGLDYSVEIQTKLDELCNGKNIFFINENKVSAVFDDFSYIDEVSIRKVYPNKLVVYAEENVERFAVVSDGNESVYHMLDGEGKKLGERAENKNNADSFRNILLEGFSYDGKKFADEELMRNIYRMCDVMNELFGGVRSNVLSITYTSPTSKKEDSFIEIKMIEGVKVKLSNPFDKAEKKINKACAFYLSMTTEERLYGMINVVELKDGGDISVSYTSRYGDIIYK